MALSDIYLGIGANSAWIRVTSHTGAQVTVKDVPMQGGATKKASTNYK